MLEHTAMSVVVGTTVVLSPVHRHILFQGSTMVVRPAVNRKVAGSSPAPGATLAERFKSSITLGVLCVLARHIIRAANSSHPKLK